MKVAKAILTVSFLLAASSSVFAQHERGMKVYAEQKCTSCHSIDGQGITNPAEMTKKTKAERKPPMRAYPSLPKEDLDALVAYMVSLKKK